MNGKVIAGIIAAIGALFGIGGVVYGADQHDKRKKEQEENRARLKQIEAELATKEQQLESLQALLGDKNEQVRVLAAEVARLRNAANEMRRSA